MKKEASLNKNNYLIFFKSLVYFLILLAVLDFSIGSALRYFYFNEESGWFYRATVAMEQTKADVIVLGSSRAEHHYHSDVFEKRLNMTFYNSGRDGEGIPYYYAVLRSTLKRYTPKIVVLDLKNDDFVFDDNAYNRLSLLLPYFKSHPEIHSIIQMRGPFEKIKLLSSVYPYNSSLVTIFLGNSKINKNTEVDYHGYLPLFGQYNLADSLLSTSFIQSDEIDTVKVNLYESFIKDCINANVKLYIFCSPIFHQSGKVTNTLKVGYTVAKKFNIPFYNFLNDTSFKNNTILFRDNMHLNDDGARVYSNMVVDTIMGLMSRKP